MLALTVETLTDINHRVNATCKYVTDTAKYDSPEWWADALEEGNEGDCEDVMIAKLRVLLGIGWPRESLRIWRCTTETNEPHAVLSVILGGEEWVLDSRHPHPIRASMLNYLWVKAYLFSERVWRDAA